MTKPLKEQEIEVKFYINDLPSVEARLRSIGAQLTQETTFEENLRFDKPDGELKRLFQVLRLRRDIHSYLTFKGPADEIEGVSIRKEIEVGVDDFDAAKQLLIELGFEISMVYEKYRSVYALHGSLISLDQLPFGNFIEIEGPNPTIVRQINQMLGLNWEARTAISYTLLFDRLLISKDLDFRDLTFNNFKGLEISSQDLQVIAADS